MMLDHTSAASLHHILYAPDRFLGRLFDGAFPWSGQSFDLSPSGQVQARDPVTFAGAAAVLVAVGVLAAWMPARRAARLDPATVLREG